MSGIDYITNSNKPYPLWIKEHKVFKNLPKIEKIFSQIGLSNFTQGIKVASLAQAKTQATYLVNDIDSYVNEKISNLRLELNSYQSVSGRDRNEKCHKIQYTTNVLLSIQLLLLRRDLITVVDGTVVISLPADLFDGTSTTPLFKKGESFFKILNKINLLLGEIKETYKITYETCASFKDFSRLNLPNKEYMMTFSSTGEDGAWDIATSSMRGITSCQTWTAPQSRGLIGSITSKYVGIVYVSGTVDYQPYGKQMIFRSIVRLIINKTTGSPALYLDAVYPAYNPDMFAPVKAVLEQRSGLKVYSYNIADEKADVLRSFNILSEPSRDFLKEGEFSYMDTPILLLNKKNSLLARKLDEHSFHNRKDIYINKITQTIADKKAEYALYVDSLSKFVASGEKDESKKPKVNPLFKDDKKGKNSYQNIINFFDHCGRRHSTSHTPVQFFADTIFSKVNNTERTFSSHKECDLWMLRQLVNNNKIIKEKAWETIRCGSWNKSFPLTAKRFLDTVMTDLKKELLLACKE